jgi:hypothetical protein
MVLRQGSVFRKLFGSYHTLNDGLTGQQFSSRRTKSATIL